MRFGGCSRVQTCWEITDPILRKQGRCTPNLVFLQLSTRLLMFRQEKRAQRELLGPAGDRPVEWGSSPRRDGGQKVRCLHQKAPANPWKTNFVPWMSRNSAGMFRTPGGVQLGAQLRGRTTTRALKTVLRRGLALAL